MRVLLITLAFVGLFWEADAIEGDPDPVTLKSSTGGANLLDDNEADQPPKKRFRDRTYSIYGSDDERAPDWIRDQSMTLLDNSLGDVSLGVSAVVAQLKSSSKPPFKKARAGKRGDRQRNVHSSRYGIVPVVEAAPRRQVMIKGSETNTCFLFSPDPVASTGGFNFAAQSVKLAEKTDQK